MARKTGITVLDYYGKYESALSVVETFIPAPRNRDPLGLRIDMVWADRQVCPEHGMKWTKVRARWRRGLLLSGLGSERPAVMFWCPVGHAWEVSLKEHVVEGSEG